MSWSLVFNGFVGLMGLWFGVGKGEEEKIEEREEEWGDRKEGKRETEWRGKKMERYKDVTERLLAVTFLS